MLTPEELVVRVIEVACKDNRKQSGKPRQLRVERTGPFQDAVVETQDGTEEGAVVGDDGPGQDRFGIMLNNPNDPKKGDHTTLRLPLPAEKGASYRLSLEVENRYENKKLTGRIEWTLYVDDRLVHQEDIALSRQAKKFELEIEKAGPVVTLKSY